MPRIELSLDIDAPIDVVWRVARKVEDFPTFMDDLQSLRVLETHDDGARTVTEWTGVIREFKMTIRWTQEDIWNQESRRDDFKMLKGDMDRMEGWWQFSPTQGGTRFDSVVEYDYDVPLIGPMIKSLIKKKMTANLDAQMRAIKQRAEAAAE